MNLIEKRLSALRSKMKENGVDAYLDVTCDYHISEYFSDYFRSLEFFSNFSGENAQILIFPTEAHLWCDGRYYIQAEHETEGTEYIIQKMGQPETPSVIELLKTSYPNGCTLAFDARSISLSLFQTLQTELVDFKFIERIDWLDELWLDRPALPNGKLWILEEKLSGESSHSRIEKLQQGYKAQKADAMLLNNLEEIAWVLNLRGSDIPNTPVFLSHLLISEKTYLFVHENKVNDEVKKYLESLNVTLYPYEKVYKVLGDLLDNKVVIYDPKSTNRAIQLAFPESCKALAQPSLCEILKAIKNETEISELRKCYLKDGIALLRFFHWFDTMIESDKTFTEWDTVEVLRAYREEMDGFLDDSFPSIAAYGGNAAMMHYSPNKEKDTIIQKSGLFLLDSGGHYLGGTTDITRTQACGPLSDEEKKSYTYTLKSAFTLLRAQFLQGTTGSKLDAIARYPLWQIGCDYKCGTGHGVGYMLAVHEGPQRVGFAPNTVALKPGMIITVEPGVYRSGRFGIRIENDCLVKEYERTEDGLFYNLETLSFVPIDTRPLIIEELDDIEINQLNSYHQDCYEKLSTLLSPEKDTELLNYLKKVTAPIQRNR